MFAFLESVLCCVKRPRVTDEYFGAVERKTLACTLDLTSVFCADAAVSSPSHFVLVGQVAQMLNQHFHPICGQPGPVRPGGRTKRFVPARCSEQTISLFVCLFFLKDPAAVKRGSYVLHTSLRRHQIYVCMRIRLAWPGGAPSAPNTSPDAWSALHRTGLWVRADPIHSVVLLIPCTAARAGPLAYLDAWIRWASGSGCTTHPWPRGSPSASAGCSWTGSPPTDTTRGSQQVPLSVTHGRRWQRQTGSDRDGQQYGSCHVAQTLTVSGLRLLSRSIVEKHSFTMAFLDWQISCKEVSFSILSPYSCISWLCTFKYD